MEREEFKRRVDRFWKIAKKDLETISKDTARLAKEGELHIKNVSEKTEKKLKLASLYLRRKELYYGLGKSLAKLSKEEWIKSKRLESLLTKINDIGYKIKELK